MNIAYNLETDIKNHLSSIWLKITFSNINYHYFPLLVLQQDQIPWFSPLYTYKILSNFPVSILYLKVIRFLKIYYKRNNCSCWLFSRHPWAPICSFFFSALFSSCEVDPYTVSHKLSCPLASTCVCSVECTSNRSQNRIGETLTYVFFMFPPCFDIQAVAAFL